MLLIQRSKKKCQKEQNKSNTRDRYLGQGLQTRHHDAQETNCALYHRVRREAENTQQSIPSFRMEKMNGKSKRHPQHWNLLQREELGSQRDKLKSGKAPYPDGILAASIQAATNTIPIVMLGRLNKLLDAQRFLPEWKKA